MGYKMLFVIALSCCAGLQSSIGPRVESGIVTKNVSNKLGFNQLARSRYDSSMAQHQLTHVPTRVAAKSSFLYRTKAYNKPDFNTYQQSYFNRSSYPMGRLGAAALGTAGVAGAHYYWNMNHDDASAETTSEQKSEEKVIEQLQKKLTKEELENAVHANIDTIVKKVKDIPMTEFYVHKDEIRKAFENIRKNLENTDPAVKSQYPELEMTFLKVDIDKIIEDMKNFSFWNPVDVYNDFMELKYLLTILPSRTQDIIFDSIENPIVKKLVKSVLQ